jgi:molybdopterin-guanine dinucleotide biosynthesis protein
MFHPVIIGVGGYTSDVGKTTLMCELLKRFPEWEAIKTTRGHYRSCGKDPHACCVSHLLSDEPLVRSGRAETYEKGKDTGRYWDAGASNVHWLICTDNQVEKGIKEALARVKSPGVFIEGNSFTEFVQTDHFVMVRRANDDKMKTSARRTIGKVTAMYVSDLGDEVEDEMKYLPTSETPLFTPSRLFSLVGYLKWNRSKLY